MIASSETSLEVIGQHLDWSDQQRRILTANDQATVYYHPDRGYSFEETELPHYHVLHSLDNPHQDVFKLWKQEQNQRDKPSPIVGAWKRVLFYGGWDFTTSVDERTFNLQSFTLFIDLRIPITRELVFTEQRRQQIHSIADLTHDELRYYARQHIFAGFSKLEYYLKGDNDHNAFDVSCTRHHVMDWNFVGTPRSRPNKWWIQPCHFVENDSNASHNNHKIKKKKQWKEWAFARDFAGQYYYCEQWEQLTVPDTNPVTQTFQKETFILALRLKSNKATNKDGMLIVIDNEFNYIVSQRSSLPLLECLPKPNSLVELIDTAVAQNDVKMARTWLGSIQGGHGHVHVNGVDNVTHNSWTINTSIDFWNQDTSLLQAGDVVINGETVEDCQIVWNNEEWVVFESSCESVEELRRLFNCLHLRRRQ
jgi:hypothetical protein